MNAAAMINAADKNVYREVPQAKNCTFIADSPETGMPV